METVIVAPGPIGRIERGCPGSVFLRLPTDVSEALSREVRRRGTSLNRTVIDLLRQSLGVPGTRSNGLARLAGTWTAADERRFLAKIRPFEEIDPGLWK